MSTMRGVGSVRLLPLSVATVAFLLAACGGGSSSSNVPKGYYTSSPAPAGGAASPTASPSAAASATVVVTTRTINGLGTILVNSQGRTLYIFAPDNHSKVTCTGTCAVVWPPLKLPSGARAVASGGANASLLGSDPDPAGGQVVTYAGWPLYTYVGDTAPGTATGQALNLNGGLWYVISPSGTVITNKPSS
jgi:predicted lipoprotein with Yx(FWY)xxD motif